MKNKEKIARVVVWIMIIGLVGAYVPLLFTPQEEYPSQSPTRETRQVTLPLIPKTENSTSSKTSSTPDTP